jgi:DNA-binding HxlR family transcriptional regulator
MLIGSHELGKRWTIPIVEEVYFKKKAKFNDISRTLKISPKVLSQRLGELEKMGIVKKISIESSEMGYELTKKGRELQKVIETTKEFYIKWDKIPDCRNIPCSRCGFFR